MGPIHFESVKRITRSAHEICDEIADVTRWSEFGGYGVLPGIEQAEYERRTAAIVGSRYSCHEYGWFPTR